MAFKGLLELSGVWPSAPGQAGYRGLNDLSGAIITSVPVVGNAGFRSSLELSGLWITGAVSEIVAPETFSGGWFDYEAYRPRFKARGKEQKKAKQFIEEIAEQILRSPQVETNRDIELILRLKLRQQELIYKNLYLKHLIKVAEHERVKKRQNDEAIMMLLIH